MSYRKELGEVIRRHRKAMNMSQENLAEQCALSPHQISDIENGKANPKYDTLMKLCAVCNINTGELPAVKDQEKISI